LSGSGNRVRGVAGGAIRPSQISRRYQNFKSTGNTAVHPKHKTTIETEITGMSDFTCDRQGLHARDFICATGRTPIDAGQSSQSFLKLATSH